MGGRTPGASSARKLISTLLTFTADRPTPTIAELATSVGVPSSTMYRYVALLRETGLVEAEAVHRGRVALEQRRQRGAVARAGRRDQLGVRGPHATP